VTARVRTIARPMQATNEPLVSSARLAMALFLAAESMLFGGLIGAFLVFRFGSVKWPPAGLPLLPVGITSVNTIILFASCIPMIRALRAIRRGDANGLRSGTLVAAALGLLFLGIQGSEWVRLVSHGLTISTGGAYGSTFYVLIGMHGFHVLGAVAWLAVIVAGSFQGRFDSHRHTPVDLATIYWIYVSALWAVLFPLVYLGLGSH
jgi:cytochrome c oxidase subunit III